MRLDKFLKVTRIIKRRTVANELADRELFKINGRIAKPSTSVKTGDILELPLGRHKLTVEVLEVRDYAKKEDVEKMYKVLNDETIKDNDITK